MTDLEKLRKLCSYLGLGSSDFYEFWKYYSGKDEGILTINLKNGQCEHYGYDVCHHNGDHNNCITKKLSEEECNNVIQLRIQYLENIVRTKIVCRINTKNYYNLADMELQKLYDK